MLGIQFTSSYSSGLNSWQIELVLGLKMTKSKTLLGVHAQALICNLETNFLLSQWQCSDKFLKVLSFRLVIENPIQKCTKTISWYRCDSLFFHKLDIWSHTENTSKHWIGVSILSMLPFSHFGLIKAFKQEKWAYFACWQGDCSINLEFCLIESMKSHWFLLSLFPRSWALHYYFAKWIYMQYPFLICFEILPILFFFFHFDENLHISMFHFWFLIFNYKFSKVVPLCSHFCYVVWLALFLPPKPNTKIEIANKGADTELILMDVFAAQIVGVCAIIVLALAQNIYDQTTTAK